MIDYDLYVMTKKERILFTLAVFGGCTALGYVFYRTALALIVSPFIYRRCEKMYSSYMISRRKKKLVLEFKDFLFLISSSLATGRHMVPSMREARAGLERIYSDSILAKELDSMIKFVDETGADEIDLLLDFSRRTQLEDIEDFTQLYQCCRQTGGNLIEAVDKAANIIGEKIAIENEIRTTASQKKLEGRIIASMPVFIIVFLQVISPNYLNVMYETITGRFIMTAALTVTAAAFVVIERITSIEI